ncbi:hypothetical protein FHS95_003663 [Sphingomonas naasensis]|uniref:DUF1579 domain-containing protein n=1 Tax=Sphingomonas naasensis TaxID=1344951 RepID=A0A4S1WI53_9SPHN|nr:DUF1579 domain-containing protein [Sphingomonas naasensis]NIJ21952.1 hypothetical protein [Sphingomonas naasensis]TGX42363.1 DUF1579 domain-containing protein [Sphingomonas naasensis]
MKTMIVVCALALGVPAAAQAQAADMATIAAQQAAMAKLAAMLGIWRGPATSTTPRGEIRMTQTERVGSFLDGTLTLVEGKAYMADGKVGFHAFGAISYDAATQSYWMSSHAQGRSGRFQLTLTDTGWTWEVPAGPATIRYVASFAGGKWTETGDYVAPGQPPRRIFEMTLSRVGDTDWPEVGSVTKQ